MRRHRSIALIVAASIVIAGCIAPPTEADLVYEIDAAVFPEDAELPGIDGGPPRPVASIVDDEGVRTDFVANELMLSTDEPAQLDALLARWNGTVLASVVPRDVGVDVPPLYLIRIETTPSPVPPGPMPYPFDVDDLSREVRAAFPESSGTFRISSQAGVDVLAAAVQEAVYAGLDASPNWVTTLAAEDIVPATVFPNALEAPTAMGTQGPPYAPNAFEWPYMTRGGDQDIGVADAWRALAAAGVIAHDDRGVFSAPDRVTILIVDGGFSANQDLPPGSRLPVATENPYECGGRPCPWHGTNVFMAAAGVAGNDFGAAGPAGPVARVIAIPTPAFDKSFFGIIEGMIDTLRFTVDLIGDLAGGAQILNVSGGAPLPREFTTLTRLDDVMGTLFAGLRAAGVLVFAAAGNDGKDVDRSRWPHLYESHTYAPCEYAGVICIGGLDVASNDRAPNSTYGTSGSGGTVDLFGPFGLWLGPTPGTVGNVATWGEGTSYASPFVAGVAALVWSADPGLSANGVADILTATAHTHSGDDDVPRWVNAFGAVKAALGDVPPTVEILAPFGNPASALLGIATDLRAETFDFEDGADCCTVTWTSSRDGTLGLGIGLHHAHAHTFTSLGLRRVTATTRDTANNVGAVSFDVDVVNPPPTLTIGTPGPDSEHLQGQPVALRATTFDPNEASNALPCTSLVWTSSVPGDPLPRTGCEVEVVFETIGARVLTVTGTDAYGATGSAAVGVSVIAPPADLPPVVRITSPKSTDPFFLHEPMTLAGTAVDPEGGDIASHAWSVAWTHRGVPSGPVSLGTAPSRSWTPSDTIGSSEGDYVVTLTYVARDAGGHAGSDTLTFEFTVVD